MITFDFELTPEEGISEMEKGMMLMAASLASDMETAHFKTVYCQEHDTNEWTEEQKDWAVENPVVETTVSLVNAKEHSGGYYCIAIGVGWFSFGKGDPLASAIPTYYEQVPDMKRLLGIKE